MEKTKRLNQEQGYVFRLFQSCYPKAKIINNTVIRDRLSDLEFTLILDYFPNKTERKEVYDLEGNQLISILNNPRDNFIIHDSCEIKKDVSFWLDVAYINESNKSDYLLWKYNSYIDPQNVLIMNGEDCKNECMKLNDYIKAELYNLEKSYKRQERMGLLESRTKMITLIGRAYLLKKFGFYLHNLHDIDRRINISKKDKKFIYSLANKDIKELIKSSKNITKWK
ncbi:MAG: hypothetical protein V1660_03890 [archaeon]